MLRKTLGSCARSSSGIGAHTSFRFAAASKELLVPKSIAYISGTNAEGMQYFRARRPRAVSQEEIGQQLVRGDGRVAGKVGYASGSKHIFVQREIAAIFPARARQDGVRCVGYDFRTARARHGRIAAQQILHCS